MAIPVGKLKVGVPPTEEDEGSWVTSTARTPWSIIHLRLLACVHGTGGSGCLFNISRASVILSCGEMQSCEKVHAQFFKEGSKAWDQTFLVENADEPKFGYLRIQ
ncbi:hypothetical protein M758_4G217300 [Ceratodon purpureus]|nr:hypothetical protein M758_4G217300 [Ceratodon purpureus]